MASPKCTCCGQTIRQPKTVALKPLDGIDERAFLASLSDAELHAFLKKVGCREDIRFFLRVAAPLRADLRAEAENLLAQLETRASKPADYKTLNRIRDAYRIDRNRSRAFVTAQARIARGLARSLARMAA